MAGEFKARIGVVTPILQSTVATGTAPFTVASTTPVTNLNIGGNAAGLSATLVATSGGTGQSSFAVGDILYASTTTALSKLAAGTSGYVLTSGGPGVAPTWQVAASGAAAAGSLTGTTLASNVVTSSLTTVGTIGTGVWQGTVVGSTYGGTGVNNGSATLTMAGSVTHAGAYTQSFTATANTAVTLPTTGTLATLAGSETLTNKTLTSPTFTGTPVAPTASQGNNSTQVATTAYVDAAMTNAIASALALAIALG